MSYTIAELNAAIRAWDTQTYSTSESGWGELADELEYADTVGIPGIGTVREESRAGGEGLDDSCWIVVSVAGVTGAKRLFRRNGWHASYDRSYYDGDTEEVEAYKETVTRYRTI